MASGFAYMTRRSTIRDCSGSRFAFRAWFNVLCAASRNGGTLPDLSELAFMLRTRPGALSRRLEALKAAGLIEEVGRRAAARRVGEAAIRPQTQTADPMRPPSGCAAFASAPRA